MFVLCKARLGHTGAFKFFIFLPFSSVTYAQVRI